MAILIKKSPSWAVGQGMKLTGTGGGLNVLSTATGGPAIVNFYQLGIQHNTSNPLAPSYPDGFVITFYTEYSGASSSVVIKRSSDDSVVFDVYAYAQTLELNPNNPGTVFYPILENATLGESYYLEIDGIVQSTPVTLPDPTPAVTSFSVDGYIDSEDKGTYVTFTATYVGNRLGTNGVIRNVSTLAEFELNGSESLSATITNDVAVPNGTYVFVINPGTPYEATSSSVVVTNP